ncbi:hypothetical protein Taro_001218 [Colocasia esculenta]|uniref:Uncharacterized protein n=1 Tax=Colocasia esculenta TaxID=4460 RepID=A0A843TIF5_COLES|nr:hypothetical protein [Colocasia esculenta]
MTMTPPTLVVPLLHIMQRHTMANSSKESTGGRDVKGDEEGGFSSHALAHELQRELPSIYREPKGHLIRDTSSCHDDKGHLAGTPCPVMMTRGTPRHVIMTRDTSQGHLVMS